MTSLDMQCRLILYAAAEAAFGLVLRTNDPIRARQALYRVRKEIGDTELTKIQIRVSPDDVEHELWLLRSTDATTVDLTEGSAHA